ncbi:aminotransferase class I/II-fold pyridoxal phosphate-dependent enzyme [Pseudosporangium ferrugineum]|uniref:dTDP-4-amino-4,6-dideoxygalactose transaminase n=1 Tax=Pseudosporangium ferrugineum TaxID=439699 RepID=A0A2T0RDM5_9ACTN|nr:aminotransferase class I/II-fold pyridoxal phosphate-dependent enzyme [Pseudosporangium ferrugineum]PRY19267.1 dTDP-4-amino-4,6-dideoxygalactose transaminase [Pseudosporangium ferrugineum]
MTGRILLSAPDVGDLEEAYVVEALRSGWVAPAGPAVDAFEREVAARSGAAHAVAVSSGTAGLHLALLACGVQAGQVVVVPTLTFAATANAVAYTGAEPVFVDSDPRTGTIDPALLGRTLDELRAEGRTVGAVIPVDLFGTCADYDELIRLCDAYGVPLIEDAAESLGSTYRGRPAGSFGAAGVISFNGNKIMTTSGGGMLLSGDRKLAERCRHLSTQARQPVPHYQHEEIGYNYRLSNLLAALGRAQLRRLDDMIGRRRALRDAYAKLFAGVDGVDLLGADEGANCWLTSIVVDPARTGWHAEDLARHLAAEHIETRPIFKPMHLQPVFAGARAVLTGVAEHLFEHGLTLPSGSVLTDADKHRILEATTDFLGRKP